MKRIIKNGFVISPHMNLREPMDIYMENGVIQGISKNIDYHNVEIIDASEKVVLPGLIDMHCSVCEPGYEYKEDIESATKAAARGGFTTITCLPNTEPAVDNKAVVEYILSKAKSDGIVHIFPYGSMSKGCKGKEIAEIGEMKLAGVVAITDGDISIMDTNLLHNIFRYARMFDIPVITHCEDLNLSGNGVVNEGYISTLMGLQGIPKEAEEVMVARNLVLAEGTKSRLHISHVSTKGSVQLIREAKKRGVQITAETSPQYFTLTEQSVSRYNTLAKVNPPLRTEEDIEAILEGLRDNTIDVISSSHTPASIESKNTEFDNATYGISNLETAFAVSYTALVEKNILTLTQLVQKMADNPAHILALNKGRLEVGADADIIVVDVKQKYAINASEFASKAKFSPYNAMEVKGKVLHTFVKGRDVLS